MGSFIKILITMVMLSLLFSLCCAQKSEEVKEVLEPETDQGSYEEAPPGEMEKSSEVSGVESSEIEGGIEDLDRVSPPEETITRKVIVKGSVRLEVENITKKLYEVKELCEKYNGRVDSQVVYAGEWGHREEGYTTCRVPVVDFYKFLEEIEELGDLKDKNISSEDVTLQHIDLVSRLKNKRRLEARYMEIAETQTGTIDDLLRIESEIARVREEIEILEGRLRNLEEMESLSTLTVELIEPGTVFQPVLDIGPTIKTTFGWALKIMVGFVGFLIILIPFVLIFLFFWYLIRWIIKLAKGKKSKQ